MADISTPMFTSDDDAVHMSDQSSELSQLSCHADLPVNHMAPPALDGCSPDAPIYIDSSNDSVHDVFDSDMVIILDSSHDSNFSSVS